MEAVSGAWPFVELIDNCIELREESQSRVRVCDSDQKLAGQLIKDEITHADSHWQT